MKSISTFAAASVMAAAGAIAAASIHQPASAQSNAQKAPKAQAGNYSKEERAALLPVQNAVTAKDWATAAAALPAAQAVARGADARYAVGRYQLEIGLNTSNVPMQALAIDTLLASGKVPAADLPLMYRNKGALALQANNKAGAEAAFAKLVELSPNDPEALVSLAQVKNDLKKPQEATQLVERAIAMRLAAGQPVDESWYKYALKIAFDSRQGPQAMRLSRALVAAYPTKENWRDALLILRDLHPGDSETALDSLRLSRAAKSLAGERDWYDLADGAYRAGLLGEAKAVLDEAAAMRAIDPNKAAFRELTRLITARAEGDRASLPAEQANAMAAADGALALKIADAWAGYGDYARAIPLYRAALGKTGVDPGIVNTRLGVALALSGDKAGAANAFKAVTGTRAELAAYWASWLARRP